MKWIQSKPSLKQVIILIGNKTVAVNVKQSQCDIKSQLK